MLLVLGKRDRQTVPPSIATLSHLSLGHFVSYSYIYVLLFSHLLCPESNRWRKRLNTQTRCAHLQVSARTLFPSIPWVRSGFGVRVKGGCFMSIPLRPTVLCSEHKHRTPETLLRKQAPLSFPVFM